MRRLLAICVLLLCASACGDDGGTTTTTLPLTTPTPLPAPTPTTYTVTGTVSSTKGPVIPNATVAVVDGMPNPNAGKITTTDSSGRYTLGGLAFAGFSVSAIAPGFAGSLRAVPLTAGTTTTTVDFGLRPMVRIQFSGLTGHGSAFSALTESAYTVTSTEGNWTVSTSYGNPAPFIQFLLPAGRLAIIGEVMVRAAGGGMFSFSSVDLYSSITPIPHIFIGLGNSTTVFSVANTQPNTFGRFATVPNPHSTTDIDALLIRLSNPSTPCCSNPMGLDNIVITY